MNRENFSKIINCLVWKFIILKWSIWQLSVKILILPLKWKLDLFTLKAMCAKIQKIILFAMKRRNNFHICLSLAVTCENKLLKIYCVLSLQLQNFFSPNLVQDLDSFSPSAVYWFWRLKLPTLKLNCNMLHISATGRRINFHIFFSLTMNCENKLLKIYCVLRQHSQDFISLKFHHPYMPWISFLFQ